jgi:hypothetical protein
MPTEVVLRHPNLPGQPYIAVVNDDGTVSPNLSDSGWVIDLDTEPGDAKNERPPARSVAPAAPHFAAHAAPDTPADQQPETTEQGDTSLEPPKES